MKREEQIVIREIRLSDYEAVLDWSKDSTFCSANEWPLNRSNEELYSWWENCVNANRPDFKRLGIEFNNKCIGYVDLANIRNATAELGIAIGESSVWEKGIGKRVLTEFMEIARRDFDITIFEAETHEANIRSRKMLESLGFIASHTVGEEMYMGQVSPLIHYRKQ